MSPASELPQESAPPWESPQWQEAVCQTPALKPFFDNLESFVELPKGVAKLRSLILDFAVRGKLVPQHTGDEPTSVLLIKIAEQRESLLKAKKIRKVKVDPIDAVPFGLPSNWSWSRLAFATLKITDGTHHSPTNTEKGEYKYVTAKNIKPDGVLLSNVTYVTKEVHDEIYDRCDPERNDLLYIKDGATTGIVTINDLDEPFSMLSSVALIKRPEEIDPKFMLYVLRSPYFYTLMRADMTGVAITRVTLAKLNKALIPIAPLAEQRRIVSKVEGLMSLCDTLEDYRRARMSVRERASRSVLASLTSSPRSEERRSLERSEDRERSSADSTDKKTSPASQRLTQPVATGKASQPHSASGGDGVSTAETLASSWQRLSDHFEVLLDQPETVPHLRQAILQLAVQGKLVRQDPTDEPASELIERISRQKASRVEAKEIPKPRPTEPINGEVPYELDESWIWTRLGVVSQYIESGWSPKCESHPRNGDDWGVLKISAVTWGVFKPEENKALPVGMDARPRCEVKVGDFLMSRANTAELVARSVVVDETPPSLMMNDKLLRVIFPSDVSAHYMNLFNNSLGSRAYYESVASGTSVSMRNVSRDNVGNLPVALPPLAEQKRIVSKVSVLLSQCDELSARLRSRQSTTDALLTALIHQILEGTK